MIFLPIWAGAEVRDTVRQKVSIEAKPSFEVIFMDEAITSVKELNFKYMVPTMADSVEFEVNQKSAMFDKDKIAEGLTYFIRNYSFSSCSFSRYDMLALDGSKVYEIGLKNTDVDKVALMRIMFYINHNKIIKIKMF
jgi:hypothetical protein